MIILLKQLRNSQDWSNAHDPRSKSRQRRSYILGQDGLTEFECLRAFHEKDSGSAVSNLATISRSAFAVGIEGRLQLADCLVSGSISDLILVKKNVFTV